MARIGSIFIAATLFAISCSEKKFSVPKEPATAGKILLAKSDAELKAQNEPRYRGVRILEDLSAIAMGWDLFRPGDGEVDYITVRRYKVVQENGNNKIIIEEFPMLYYVDFDNSAEGKTGSMYGFADEDADGDPSNARLVQDPRKSNP